MKLLLDSCAWGPATHELSAAGHDAIWVGNWPSDPGDRDILARAHAEGRTLITLDRDFGALAIVNEQPHSGIIRLVGIPSRQQAQACLQVIGQHEGELASGAIVTVDRNRVRIRPAD